MPPRLTDERPQGDIFLSLEMVLSCDAARHEPESALGQQLPLRTGCPAGGAAGHQPSRDLISRGSGRTRGPVGTCPPCGCRQLSSLPPQDDTKSAPGEGVTELTEATDQGRPTDSKATAENNSLWPRFGGDLPPRNWNGPAFQPAPSAPKDSEWYGSYKGGGRSRGIPLLSSAHGVPLCPALESSSAHVKTFSAGWRAPRFPWMVLTSPNEELCPGEGPLGAARTHVCSREHRDVPPGGAPGRAGQRRAAMGRDELQSCPGGHGNLGTALPCPEPASLSMRHDKMTCRQGEVRCHFQGIEIIETRGSFLKYIYTLASVRVRVTAVMTTFSVSRCPSLCPGSCMSLMHSTAHSTGRGLGRGRSFCTEQERIAEART